MENNLVEAVPTVRSGSAAFFFAPWVSEPAGKLLQAPLPLRAEAISKGALQLRRASPLGVLADPHWYCPASVVLGVGENGNDLVAHNP